MSRRRSVGWRLVNEVSVEELPAIDVDALCIGGLPTADDVTILRDGTRLDTPAKVIAYVEQFKAELAARTRHSGADRGT